MRELPTELFSVESDFVPDEEKLAHGLSALIGNPPGKTLILAAEPRTWHVDHYLSI